MGQLWQWLIAAGLIAAGFFLLALLWRPARKSIHVFRLGGWGCLTGRGHKLEDFVRWDDTYTHLIEMKVCRKCNLVIDNKRVPEDDSSSCK